MFAPHKGLRISFYLSSLFQRVKASVNIVLRPLQHLRDFCCGRLLALLYNFLGLFQYFFCSLHCNKV